MIGIRLKRIEGVYRQLHVTGDGFDSDLKGLVVGAGKKRDLNATVLNQPIKFLVSPDAQLTKLAD